MSFTGFLYFCIIKINRMKTVYITDKSEIDSVINQCDVCFVGLVEADGTPYVIPMNFGYINNDIILHSAPDGKHVGLLALNNHVCVTFCSDNKLVYQHQDVACSYRMLSKSVICKGAVTFIEDLLEKEVALNALMKNYTDRTFKYSTPALMNVKVWRVTVNELTGKAFGQKPKLLHV